MDLDPHLKKSILEYKNYPKPKIVISKWIQPMHISSHQNGEELIIYSDVG